MSLDPSPYPDLDGTAVGTPDEPVEPVAPKTELDEADSRLLDALSRPQPPVVTAVEDQPPATRPARTSAPTSGTSLAPVFQEPVG